MRVRFRFFYLLLVACLSMFVAGCESHDETESAGLMEDIPLASYQDKLLSIAYEAASAIPINPHIKSRSRMQETVVKACLELDQPQRALRYIEQIENWRRGAGYADLAFYCARRGFKDKVDTYLNLAARIAEENEDWRKDRIKVKISKTHAYLGQTESATQFERGVEDSETGKVARVKAMICPADAFDEQMEELTTLVSTANFDIVRNALGAYSELYNRFYEDVERRALIEEKIKASWSRLPIFVRMELLTELVDFSLSHGDRPKALELINEATELKDSAIWQLRFRIPVKTGLAELRFRAGDEERARAEIQDALEMFDADREKIVNIDRAGILRSIAEAYQAMGDITLTRDVYKRALEAGIENPNSRPRAEDLTATCCSMALHAMEPGEELFSRICEIHDGLDDPW